MKHSAKRLFSMVLSLGMITAAFIVFFSFTRPTYENIQQIRNEKYTFDLELENKRQAIEDVKNLIEEHKNDSDFNKLISLVFPIEPELSSALAQIYSLAVDINKLALVNISISKSTTQSSISSGGSEPGQVSLQKPINTLTFDLNLTGSYGNFKEFLQKIENNIRLFDVENVTLTPTALGAKVPVDLYNYQVKIIAYYQGQE